MTDFSLPKFENTAKCCPNQSDWRKFRLSVTNFSFLADFSLAQFYSSYYIFQRTHLDLLAACLFSSIFRQSQFFIIHNNAQIAVLQFYNGSHLFHNIIMYTQQQTEEEARILASRMRNGTGAASLLHAEDAPTHRMDALQRFQKDFAFYQRQRRDDEKQRRQSQLERKRIEQLQRQNKRWEMVQNYQQKLKQREQYSVQNQRLGIKRTANTNGLAYNPITLEYDRNPEGERLKRLDEDAKIRGYVRAHNMDHNGNSKYNPLTGQNRLGIEQVVPNQLNQRFQTKKYEHYEHLRLKVPSSANDGRPSSYSKFY